MCLITFQFLTYQTYNQLIRSSFLKGHFTNTGNLVHEQLDFAYIFDTETIRAYVYCLGIRKRQWLINKYTHTYISFYTFHFVNFYILRDSDQNRHKYQPTMYYKNISSV